MLLKLDALLRSMALNSAVDHTGGCVHQFLCTWFSFLHSTLEGQWNLAQSHLFYSGSSLLILGISTVTETHYFNSFLVTIPIDCLRPGDFNFAQHR